MTWAMTAAGVVVILYALRDLFHTLWHPSGFGTLSRIVFRGTWRLTKLNRRGSGTTELAGPLGLLATLGMWAGLSVLGFALLYLPRMPDGFYFGSSLEPQKSSDIVASLYLSIVAVATLGFGDILPATPLLRIVAPLEALVGFVLLTAGISWVLQLYPALIRRRALARRLTTMARCGATEVVERGEASIAVQYLEGVRSELARTEMDLVQYAESYFFREARSDVSLAATLSYVVDLVAAGERSSASEVRNAAVMLASAMDEFLILLRREYLGELDGQAETLAAFARDHQQPLPR
ncbi:MAG TPA: potassium channel family protein [Marmoricola sp.]|nr:potassium channel family protein [Marmoricola sp.]